MAADVTRRMSTWQEICASTVLVMSMTQLVIGTALGFFVAQGVLYSIKHVIGWVQRGCHHVRCVGCRRLFGSANCTQRGDGRHPRTLNGRARIGRASLTGRGCGTCSGAQARSLNSGSG